LDSFALESKTAYGFDDDFVASGTGATVTDVPAGFCDEQVYIDLQNAQDALAELESESAYAEWLAAQEATLAADAIDNLSTAGGNADDAIDATQPDVDGIILELFEDDLNEIFYSEEEYLDYLMSEFDADVIFERQNIVNDLENVPTELPESLDDQDNVIPTLLPQAVEAVAEANNLLNFANWLLEDGDPSSRIPTECVEECCEWREMIREIESGAEDQAAAVLNGLEPGVDSEANRSAFAATDPVLNEFAVPEQEIGETCTGYEDYSDRFTVATSTNAFVAAFEAWCAEDADNCPAE